MQPTRQDPNQVELGIRSFKKDSENSNENKHNLRSESIMMRNGSVMIDQNLSSISLILAKNDAYIEAIDKLRLFPFFGDKDLQNLPLKYYLYLEFLHMSIRVFMGLLGFSVLLYIIYFTLLEAYPKIQTQFYTLLAFVGLFLSSGLFLRIVREKQEKKLVETNVLNNIPFTEDLFSLLVESLPKETTKREISAFFNGILQQENGGGSVKKVILLQDYHEYAQTKKEIRKIDKKLATLKGQDMKTEKAKFQLLNKKSHLAGLLGQLEVEIIHFKCFKGKAIVIFDSIQSKATIAQYFNVTSWLAYWSKDKKYFFKDKRFHLALLPEPQDLIFENIHYSTTYRIILTISLYLLSFGIAGLIILGMLYVSFIPSFHIKDDLSAVDLVITLTSFPFIISILCLSFILRRSFRFINRQLIYASALHAETSSYFFTTWISLLLYVPTQLVPSFSDYEPSLLKLVMVALCYLLKKIIFKTASICMKNRTERRPSDMTLNGLLIKDHGDNSNEIDFVEGINDAIPLIFMGFTSMIVNLFVLLPVVVFSLYIITVIEKYRIKRFCNLERLKSVRYILKAFTVFRWDCFCAFGTCFIILKAYSDTLIEEGGVISDAVWCLCVLGVLAILCYIWWPSSLDEQVKNDFIKRNLNIQYDVVSKDFTSFYHIQDPLKRITN